MSALFIPAYEPDREFLAMQEVSNRGFLISVHANLCLPKIDIRRSCVFTDRVDLIKAMIESAPETKAKILAYLQDGSKQKDPAFNVLPGPGPSKVL